MKSRFFMIFPVVCCVALTYTEVNILMARSIIFCASQRFADDLKAFIERLKEATPPGVSLTIFDPGFAEDETNKKLRNLNEKDRLQDPIYRAEVAGKVHQHNRRIKVADVCFIFNKGGYIGHNTHAELVVAAERGKLCFALERPILMGKHPDHLHEEPSAMEYIDDFIDSPAELIKRLL